MVQFANKKLALKNQKWDFSHINFSFHSLFKVVFKKFKHTQGAAG